MGYLRTAYFHCHIPVLNIELYPVKMLTDFYELIQFYDVFEASLTSRV